MRRYFFIIMFLPLASLGQKFSASDLKQLKLYCGGVFTNDVEAVADTHFIRPSLKVQSIWTNRKDGVWLFTERTDTAVSYQVWHFYLQDDSTLLMQLLDFKQKQKAQSLSNDIKQQSDLYLNNLSPRHGCEVYLKKNKTGYTGASSGKDCFADIAGAEYITFNVSITKNTIGWRQQLYDKDDKELTSNNSGYNFVKQVKSSK